MGTQQGSTQEQQEQPVLFISEQFDYFGGIRFRVFDQAFALWERYNKRIPPRDCFKLVVSL